MPLGIEFKFLKDVLKKCHISISIHSPLEKADELIDPKLKDIFGVEFDKDLLIKDYLGDIEPRTRYRITDSFKLSHIYFLFPTTDARNLIYIGPFLSSSQNENDIMELGEKMKIEPMTQKYAGEYYQGLPVLSEGDNVFAVIDTFCEHIWHSPSFAIVDVDKHEAFPSSQINYITKNNDFDDVMAKVNIMERRYAFENELMQAVSLGQQHKAELLMSAIGEYSFEKRVSDPVRNAKNYSIIMNTLLRKAAEDGGVHPIYIDRLSSGFAERIEGIKSIGENAELMKEMFSEYCRLVYKHSIKKYSPIVQKAVLLIESDFSAELSLSALAENQGISAGYLATVFKRETGKTVSEHIRERRIKHAKYLLSTTNLQIQTIALHCGIMDVQYFSKIFKKTVGKTPKEYRESQKNRD